MKQVLGGLLSPPAGFLGVPNCIQTELRCAIPPVSANVKAKVPREPEPVPGETETLLGTEFAVPQMPSSCQPEVTLPVPVAEPYTFLTPANAGLNEIKRFSVDLFPPADAVDAPLTTHWLFCTVLTLLSRIGPNQAEPESSASWRVREYVFTRIEHPPELLAEVLNNA